MKDRVLIGFTLIELLVVIAILAFLTALVLPKFDALQTKAGHGIGAESADDTGRAIQTYKVTHNKYPDGWDSLIDTTAGTLWSTTDLTKPAINSELSGAFDATKAKLALSPTPFTAGQIACLQRSGIVNVYNLTPASTDIPGSRFTTAEVVTTATKYATVNAGTVNGKKIIDHIYPANLRTGGVTGTLPANKTLVAFGFGPNNILVGTQMLETPYYPNVDPTLVYNRNIVIFEVDANGGHADLKAVLGADGDLLSDMANTFFK